MTYRLCALSLLVFSAFAAPAATAGVSPAGRNFGVGVELGAPTSINFKLMTASDEGLVVGIGGGIWYDASLSLHADYLWHPFAAGFDGGTFSAFIGVGAWTSLGYVGNRYGFYQPYGRGDAPLALGARVPLGLSLAFNRMPIELFIEVVPSISVFPGIGAFGQGGFGARFYF